MAQRGWLIGMIGGALAMAVVLFASFARAEPAIASISADELSQMLPQGVTVIDVRRPDEWRATGIIEGSHLITAFDAQGRPNPRFLNEVMAAVDRDAPVALICRSGNRSGVAARFLAEEAGFDKVYNVTGGIRQWRDQGGPVMPCASC